MFNPENPFQDIREALRCGEVGLRGPMKGHQDEIAHIQSVARTHVNNEWLRTRAAVSLMSGQTDFADIDEESQTLPDYFSDSFATLAGHFVVAIARHTCDEPVEYHDNPFDKMLPQLFDEFTAINGILSLTRNEFTRRRHPALGLSPEEASSLATRARAVGFTNSHIKKFAESKNPDGALKKATLSMLKIECSGSSLKPSIMRKLATHRSNGVAAAKEFVETVESVKIAFAENPQVTNSDIEHFVRNYNNASVKQGLDDFVDRIEKYTKKYAGHEVIDQHVVRAICRRSKDPQDVFDRILDRHTVLCETYPSVSDRLGAYLARNYSDPVEALRDALKALGKDPDLADVLQTTKTNDIWDVLQGKK